MYGVENGYNKTIVLYPQAISVFRYSGICIQTSVSHCTVSSVHYTLYSVQCTLYTVHCTLCTVYCTLYTVHCTLYTVHCTLYTVHCTLYTVHCTLYIVNCALYTVVVKEHSAFLSLYRGDYRVLLARLMVQFAAKEK